ncbi:MAG: hypothetical protein KatS3mg042_0392 [Rhodothermaceae bacterium]|nr:MAG: hypothetical protein KatS3mg042_0392 [Rhodothermaceae bacterium]
MRLIPNLFSDNGGECAFDMAEVTEAAFGYPASDRIYAYYPTTTYEDFEAAVKPLVDADPNGCPNAFDATGGAIEDLIDFGRDRSLQRIVVADYAGDGMPPLPGTVIRFLTTEPPPPPVPAAPRDGAVVAPGTVVLWWNEHPQGLPYTLQVATTPDFAAPIVNETGLTGTSYELSGVQAGSTYYWRVRLPSSDWSPVWSFTVDTATGVEEAGLPRVFALAPVYPNPLREEATIRFDLPHRERVELKVYNVLGQEVATLASGSYAAGRHTVRWRPSSVASGVYYVRMKAGAFRQSRSLLVVR